MPPRTYEEAIRFDRELAVLSEEIMNLESWASPSKATLAGIARLRQQYEDRHDAILLEIEEEKRSAKDKAEADAWEAKFRAKPGAIEFAAYLELLGKSASTISMFKSLFMNLHSLAMQPKGIKRGMRCHLDAFIQELTEEELAKYSASIHKVIDATGDVDPEIFNPNPAARDFNVYLESIGVAASTAYVLGDLFADYHDLADQPEDIKKEMVAVLDAFIQQLTEEQLAKYATVIDEVGKAART